MRTKLLVLTVIAAACLSVGCRRSDPDIAAEAYVKVVTDPQLRELEPEITSEYGVVRLAGETRSTQDQTRAVSLVSAVPGVRAVVNAMWVRDGIVLDNVRHRLADDPVARPVVIEVQVERGVVRLYGDTTTREERQRAVELARQVDGVRRVEDWMK